VTRDLIPFTQLTRFGVPDFRVTRRALTLGEVTLAVGTQLNPDLIPAAIRLTRLRQFYEQRLLEPVVAPKGTRQAHRASPPASAPPVLAVSSQPIPTVATDAAVIPSVDIPVSTAPSYAPPRQASKSNKGVR